MSYAPKLPVGPAKEKRWRRVLRTTGKDLFLMRWCAVKHRISKYFHAENHGFYEISELPGNFNFSQKLKIRGEVKDFL